MKIATCTRNPFSEMPRFAEGRAFRLVACTVMFVVSCCSSSEAQTNCRPFDDSMREENRAAMKWIHHQNSTNQLPPVKEQVGEVIELRISDAISLLNLDSFKPISEARALDFTGQHRPPTAPSSRLSPYLVRAVGAFSLSGHIAAFVHQNGDVQTSFGTLSHCDVPMRRRPIVVWLSGPPRHVYVSFSVAE